MTDPYAAQEANHEGAVAASGMVTGPTREALRGTKVWVKLVGILLLIGAVFTVLAAAAVMLGVGTMGGSKQSSPPLVMMAVMCTFYFVIAAIYVFLGMYLLKYARAIGQLMVDDDVATLELALQSQQKFWRLAGIMVLIMLVLSLIGIVAAIVIPMMASR